MINRVHARRPKWNKHSSYLRVKYVHSAVYSLFKAYLAGPVYAVPYVLHHFYLRLYFSIHVLHKGSHDTRACGYNWEWEGKWGTIYRKGNYRNFTLIVSWAVASHTEFLRWSPGERHASWTLSVHKFCIAPNDSFCHSFKGSKMFFV